MKHTNAKNTFGALMTVVMLLLNSITVAAANSAPVTVNDVLSVSQGSSATINPLINDVDADGDALVILQAGNGIHGTVTFTTGSVTYAPNAGYVGGDRFAYLVSDGKGGQAIGSVAVTVSGVNDAPVANDDA
ncbi:MAG: Ig-like domain-containing protein, partial [Nanoarchaeota archaeon]